MSCCKEYAQSISEYLDGALNEKEQQLLLEHIEGCEGCRAYLAELAAMRDALAELPEAELPEGFHASVMEKVKAKKRAKRALLWKRYVPAAACAAIVLLAAARLMPDFGASSSAPETADMAMDMMAEGGAAEEEAPAAAGGSEQRTTEYAVTESAQENLSHHLDAEPAAQNDAEPKETPVEDAEAEKASLPTVRGENVYKTLLALGAQELSGAPWLLVPAEVLENLPEGLELVGEFDAERELVPVMVEEVAS